MENLMYLPGSDWIYYKIYCSASFSDRLLNKTIKPFVEDAILTGEVANWFFIRYYDPQPHIRIRIKCVRNHWHIIKIFSFQLSKHTKDGIISEVAISTYKPELSRYGKSNMLIIEDLFYHESDFVLKLLFLNISYKEYYLAVWYVLNQKVKLLLINQEDRILFLKQNYEAFSNEFSLDAKTRKALSKKYDENKPHYFKLNNNTFFDKTISSLVQSYCEVYRKTYSLLPKKGHKVLNSSLLHMFVNRCFNKNQREMELVLYYDLYKFSVSDSKRKR